MLATSRSQICDLKRSDSRERIIKMSDIKKGKKRQMKGNLLIEVKDIQGLVDGSGI